MISTIVNTAPTGIANSQTLSLTSLLRMSCIEATSSTPPTRSNLKAVMISNNYTISIIHWSFYSNRLKRLSHPFIKPSFQRSFLIAPSYPLIPSTCTDLQSSSGCPCPSEYPPPPHETGLHISAYPCASAPPHRSSNSSRGS